MKPAMLYLGNAASKSPSPIPISGWSRIIFSVARQVYSRNRPECVSAAAAPTRISSGPADTAMTANASTPITSSFRRSARNWPRLVSAIARKIASENMPVAIQVVTYVVPSRYFITILKGIYLKGTGVEILWRELVFLLIFAITVFTLAIRKMRQKIA